MFAVITFSSDGSVEYCTVSLAMRSAASDFSSSSFLMRPGAPDKSSDSRPSDTNSRLKNEPTISVPSDLKCCASAWLGEHVERDPLARDVAGHANLERSLAVEPARQ